MTLERMFYDCPKCKSYNGTRRQRCRLDNSHSIQFATCNICGYEWKEIWTSYSGYIWTSQKQHAAKNKEILPTLSRI